MRIDSSSRRMSVRLRAASVSVASLLGICAGWCTGHADAAARCTRTLSPRLAATIALLLGIGWVGTVVMVCSHCHGSAIVAFERQDNDARGVATGASKSLRHGSENGKVDAGSVYSRNARVFTAKRFRAAALILKRGRSSNFIDNARVDERRDATPLSSQTTSARVYGFRSMTIIEKDLGSTGPLRRLPVASGGTGPNFAETTKMR